MKTKVKLSIFLFFGLLSLIYVFPFIFVEAAKLESGVTIKEAAPPTNETAPPTNEICNNGIDDNGNGATDEVTCLPPPAGTCGLQIVSGVPINYGQLTAGQTSADKQVIVKNEGTSPVGFAKIMVKGGNWISDAAPNPTISGPEITRVALAPIDFNSKESLSLAGSELSNLPSGSSIPIYFQFRAWVNGLSGSFPSGSFHQEVTIDLLC